MPRRYTATTRRTRRYARAVAARSKYSIETNMSEQNTSGRATFVSDTDTAGFVDVVPAATIQGMRKVKHMQVTVCMQHGAAAANLAGGAPIVWAMVYVPAGQLDPIPAPSMTESIYEPNQFVICSGIADADAGPIRINTPLARNLNSGDRICLTWRLLNGQVVNHQDPSSTLVTMCRYAITLN